MSKAKALKEIIRLRQLSEDPRLVQPSVPKLADQAIAELKNLEEQASMSDFLDGFVTLRHSKILHANSDGVKKIVAKGEYPEYLVNEAHELGWTECMETLMEEWKKYKKGDDKQ